MCRSEFDITNEDLNPTFLFTSEFIRKASNHPHTHDFMELMLIRDGEGSFTIDQQRYHVQKGDLLFINPGILHQGHPPISDTPLREFYIGFCDFCFKGQEANTMHLPGGSCILHLDEKPFITISRLADQMNLEATSTHPGRYFMLRSLLTQMILLLYRMLNEKEEDYREGFYFESNGHQYVVEQIVDYMHQHYNEKISLDQIAANMYLSPFYISRIFKNELQDTPINYLITLRMEKACELLAQDSRLAIQDIARSVGYDDAYYFSKLFKKHYGISPSNYRKTVNT